jgi:hypothetical protein
MALIPLGILSAAGAGGVQGDYELISSTILGTAQASVVFDVSSFASTYKHLQIRSVTRSNYGAQFEIIYLRFNADTGANYSVHSLVGSGSTVTSNSGVNADTALASISAGGTNTTGVYSPAIIDILDPFSTTKNKTVRAFTGLTDSNRELRISSGAWRNTNAITSATVLPLLGTTWSAGSRFSLYGIKG